MPTVEHRRMFAVETQCRGALAYDDHNPHTASPERSKGQYEGSSKRALNKEDRAISRTSSALA